MRCPSYLFLSRHGIYYLRLILSPALSPDQKPKELRRSLRTAHLPTARAMAWPLVGGVKTILDRAIRLGMDLNAVRKTLNEYLDKRLEEDEYALAARNAASNDAESEEALLALMENREEAEEEARLACEGEIFHTHHALTTGLFPPKEDILTYVSERLALSLSPLSVELEQVSREAHKMWIAYQTVKKSRLQGDYSLEPSYLPISDTNTPDTPLLSEIISKFVSEHPDWVDKTRRENEAIYCQLIEIVGDIPSSSIEYQTAQTFKGALMRLPANRHKKRAYRGKTVAQLIAMEGVQPASTTTINKHLNRLSTLFSWATKNGYLEKNFAEGIQLKKSKRADQERNAFTSQDLSALFGSTIYTDLKFSKPHYYWLPLIALHSGARIEEICQLHLSDLHKDGDIWVFDINRADGKKVKTNSGERLIPIHPKLVSLGLLEYAQTLINKREERLFPQLKRQRDGYSTGNAPIFSGNYE